MIMLAQIDAFNPHFLSCGESQNMEVSLIYRSKVINMKLLYH